MDKRRVALVDLIDLGYLQLMQDGFARVTGCAISFVDPGVIPVTRPSDPQGFCKQPGPSGDVEGRCTAEHRKLCRECRRTCAPVVRACPFTGLAMGAAPFFFEGEYLGSWLVGQVRITGEDSLPVLRVAPEAGTDSKEAAKKVRKLPESAHQVFENIFSFLITITETLVQMAQANFNVSKSNTELLETAERLELTAQMLTRFTNSADVGMFVTDFFTGEILQANNRYAQFMHVPAEQLIGRQCWVGMDPSYTYYCPDCPHDKLLDEKGRPRKPFVWERYLPERDMWLKYSNQAIYWVDGRLAHMVTFVDITRTKRMQAQLAQLAYFDRNMLLPNGLKLVQDLEECQDLEGIFLICFDIVSLRTINDVYSREAGDALLDAICDWIRGLGIMDSVLYRVDGDEFCVMVRQTEMCAARRLAERLYVRFEEPWIFPLNGETLHIFVGVSMSVVDCKKHANAGGNLLDFIERTLATARKNGKIATYDELMDQEYKEHLTLQLSLKKCVKEGMIGFDVYYQPIVNPSTGTWSSLEALCRWNSPECGPVPPLVFIHEAEQLGLIGTIGRWVLESAVRQCKEWGLDKHPSFVLDVNLSPTQITDEGIVNTVIDILRKYDYPGEKLSLEITESAELNFGNHTMNSIERLRSVRVLVALDDFGTGYSSFNSLKSLPVSLLKTERAFIHNIENDSYLQYLFYVMVELAHAANMKIIAEGVETIDQVELLLRNGADYLQGYLFSHPLPASELAKSLDRFYKVDETLYERPKSKIDIAKLTGSHDRFALMPGLHQILLQCMQILLSYPDQNAAINEVLGLVGAKFRVSRAYLFLREGNGLFSNTHEWCAADVSPQQYNLQSVNICEVAASWIPLLREKGIILASDVSTLPHDIFKTLEPQQIKSIVAMPLWDNDELVGFMGFDDCNAQREWMPEEVIMLHNLCMVVVTVLEKKRLQQDIYRRNAILSRMMDNLDIAIYVSDLKTNEVICANEKMHSTFESEGGMLEGGLCWERIWGEEQRCAFCRLPELLNSGERSMSWEIRSRQGDRYYQARSSIIPWEDGGSAHLCYLTDITENKKYQEKLEMYATTDIATETLNRGAFLKKLQVEVRRACAYAMPLAVCLVGIGDMKSHNEKFGIESGDALILETARTLKAYVRQQDVIGRYSGAVFALALLGCSCKTAQNKIEQALTILWQAGREKGVEYAFSYGIVAASEIPFENEEDHLAQLLEIAEDRMRSFVTKRKISSVR